MDELSSKYLVQMVERERIYSVLELAGHLPYTVMDVISEAARLGYSFDNLMQDPNKVMIVKGEHVAKQPHVRIEFDDIRDVPKVWVGGELIGEVDDKPLVSLKVDWSTDTTTENHKGFDVNYYDLTGERPMRRGFREGTTR